MYNDEFATRVYLRLIDRFPHLNNEMFQESLFTILEDVRGVEREAYDRERFLLERIDIHPVCKC